ncbi:MAG: hypothetical protein GX901_07665 [Lentisphaerae bacterium]|nr:hypothetical protein [Lentisphaerota bacterium]
MRKNIVLIVFFFACASQFAQAEKKRRYPDEIDYRYHFDVPMPKNTKEGVLNDGDDKTEVNWHQRKVAVICEFDRTYEISSMEIVTKKHTKWYILKELHISLDDGSGEFAAPFIVKTYGKLPEKGAPLIDESCRSYVYQPEIKGLACRVKIDFVGSAAIGVSEIRLRGREPEPPPNNQRYFFK